MKIGRNQPCPCNSGKKYKYCHGDVRTPRAQPAPPELAKFIAAAQAQHEARQHEIQRQFGKGRAPIAGQVGDQRFVAVGPELHHSDRWKTFPDFLMSYFKTVMGQEWGEAQLAKPVDQRHPLFDWYVRTCDHQAATIKTPGEIASAPMNGATVGIMFLTYGLYLLRHNAELQKRLLDRLRTDDPVQIFGAVYEVLVAATLIWAGFELELEDETDGSTTHCEFTATAKGSGKKYSVEAKVCDPGASGAAEGRDRVVRQLTRALMKKANHPRLVFIDLNKSFHGAGAVEQAHQYLDRACDAIYRQEASMKIHGEPAPPAYYALTMFPFRHLLEDINIGRAAAVEGFKIPDLKHGAQFTLRKMAAVRKEHKDVLDIQDAFGRLTIPVTLDGELPSRAFGKKGDPIRIGDSYQFIGDDGAMHTGELVQAVVNEGGKGALATLREPNGRYVMVTMPLSEDDLAIYRDSPETYFGRLERRADPKTPVEMYEWLLEANAGMKKETILKGLERHPEFEKYRDLPQEELLELYCEALAWNSFARRNRPAPQAEVQTMPAAQAEPEGEEQP
jgi:hypothetical protein